MPRPKRAGGEFHRAYDEFKSSQPTAKKPRFDARNPSVLAAHADDEDAILELDEIGRGGQPKRNAVNIDGYESDSSNDNFDARADAKAKREKDAKKNAEVEEDLFAESEKEEEEEEEGEDDFSRAAKKRDKTVRFLDPQAIQGQVADSKSGGHVSADFLLSGKGKERVKDVESSSESGSDEERDRVGSEVDEELGAGSKKKHAPRLEAFNMKEEAEEGKFDANGAFIRNAVDPNAVHDSWLEGLSKRDMKRAREAQEKRDEDRRRRDREDDAVPTSDILARLIRYLQPVETILEALQRLGKGKGKQKPKWQKKQRNGNAMDVDEGAEEEDPAETQRKQAVEAITAAADQLLTRGQLEIYDAERELLIRQYQRETGEPWVEPTTSSAPNGPDQAAQWEYRWSDGREDGARHGPYDAATMKAWSDAGYFGEGVEFRRVGYSEWSRLVDFV
ncbi:hypothetical protein P152DRAFT_306895 [Eremomyces bilateralis CBS 781.70]|uniref:GYF domain-containing protein n=1 Tax=Eremomyces bilateralis CBS 781.70 TaxID=1392243 RepID=A0A6G1G506_9PEZI|nr:uncharacterized protein P152DRAFT_306895 [Eremomyces bilateralis CBS 781.70]KAF1813157.1 hypothetical protein P152DRAFT_306895 [Eremomyces bilateralis CBS 781.70]